MTYKDLKENRIYYCLWPSTNRKYTFRKVEKSCPYIITERDGYLASYNKGDFSYNSGEFREPTSQEKEHFLQCEKAGKYVEYKPENIEILIFN